MFRGYPSLKVGDQAKLKNLFATVEIGQCQGNHQKMTTLEKEKGKETK